MIGLSRRSSISRPWSGSEAATGVPGTLGTRVAVAGTSVLTAAAGVATGRGVAVAGRVGRGVSKTAGLSETGVGGGGGGGGDAAPIPHAADSAPRMSTAQGNRRRIQLLDAKNIPASG